MNGFERAAVTTITVITLSAGVLVAPAASAGTTRHPGVRSRVGTTASHRAPRTRLVFRVRGCNGCRIRPTQALPTSASQWRGKGGTVEHGRLALRVPTARSHGMAFEVDIPWQVDSLNAQVYLATRYAGKAPGERVSSGYAASARRGTACWNGTTKERQRFRVRVDRFRQDAFDGSPGWAPRAFTRKTLDAPGKRSYERLYKGVVGAQEAWTC